METTRESAQNQARWGSAGQKGDQESLTANEHIRLLLEMLDNPDAYSEQEILDIINRDGDTREAYRLMVEAKRSRRHRQDQKPADRDAAWQRFNQKRQPGQKGFRWVRTAAAFIGVLLVSGIAFAAIHIVRQYQERDAPKAAETTRMERPVTTAPADTLASDTVAVQPVVFDNIPLEKMLPEIAAHYGVKVFFANDEARRLRFRFVWNPQQGIDQVVSDLGKFERLTVTLNDNEMTIE